MNGQAFKFCEFEIEQIHTHLGGKIAATVYEVGGDAPTNIIGTDQDWKVVVEWEIYGHIVRHLCGKWVIGLSLESIGTAPEYDFPRVYIDMDPCGDGKYSHTFLIKADEVFADEDGTVYLPAVTLSSRDPCDKPGYIGAFCRGGSVMIFQQAPHKP
ncbi:hypothetical protein RZS08_05960 [Arthrospira platensis SPKY1]|nr:hypothetical protein [Arthrospira platensis SPKY1]